MPRLSIIVVVYNMARQAMNTLYSLSPRYQQNVHADDYEVIVIENVSANTLDPEQVCQLGHNIHYTLREESSVSPAAAINEGFRQTKAPFIGLLIDGARMVTPRVIEYALAAQRMSAHALVTVTGFNLGPELHYNVDRQYGEEQEKNLLERICWQENGYRLFDISNLGEANPRGIFQPFMENNCYFSSVENFQEIGFADEQFQLPGGGSLNLHMYRSVGMLPRCEHYFVMAGEANFHQFHGGVTTAKRSDRDALLLQFKEQLEKKWGGRFPALEREPVLIGAVTSHAQGLLHYSSVRGQKRYNRLHDNQVLFCQDDRQRQGFRYQSDTGLFTKCDPR